MKIIDVPQSGKCGLTVTFPSRYGLTRRAWVVPANPRTADQQKVRGSMAMTAEAFRSLTQQQQDAWNAAASQVQSKSVLGQSGPLTGAQLFMKDSATPTAGRRLADHGVSRDSHGTSRAQCRVGRLLMQIAPGNAQRATKRLAARAELNHCLPS